MRTLLITIEVLTMIAAFVACLVYPPYALVGLLVLGMAAILLIFTLP